jgi:hypothetical protein
MTCCCCCLLDFFRGNNGECAVLADVGDCEQEKGERRRFRCRRISISSTLISVHVQCSIDLLLEQAKHAKRHGSVGYLGEMIACLESNLLRRGHKREGTRTHIYLVRCVAEHPNQCWKQNVDVSSHLGGRRKTSVSVLNARRRVLPCPGDVRRGDVPNSTR